MLMIFQKKIFQLDSKVAETSEDKRFYLYLKNAENKKLLQFKTNIIKIPF